MEIEFYGATSGITGSCHIIRANGHLVLLDCGLIQGRRQEEEKNRNPFPFSPDDIDAVVLSHGHIDHSGRLPLLLKQGYQGPIYTHHATRELCSILLQDSASLQEQDARYENKRRQRKNKPEIEPLYRVDDALHVLDNMQGLNYREEKTILPGIRVRLQDAGHILGSASVELWLNEDGREVKIVFSGDLGQYDTPIINDPAVIESADHVIIESTYGARLHRDREKTVAEIGEVITQARHQRGNLLIPAFAVGRSQEILYYLAQYYEQWEVDRWQVFLDSPMAIKASKVYWEFANLYDQEASDLRLKVRQMPVLGNLHLTSSPEESMAINQIDSGAIIIAGSGMCNGGRILHHFKQNISHSGTQIMIVGYQAEGTLGRRLVEGQEQVKIHGKYYHVRAKVHTVGGLSAHADQEDLLQWISNFKTHPTVHIVHGEPESKEVLWTRLKEDHQLNATIPGPGEIVKL